MSKQINLDKLKILHHVGGVLQSYPNSWELLKTIPEDLIENWKNYLDAKDRFNDVLKSYGFEDTV